MMTAPLHDRTAVVTGLSRRIGIGYSIVERLLAAGALVYATGWSAHDAEMPWGLDPFDQSDFDEGRFAHTEADMADPEVPARLLAEATDRFGPVDIVVAAHARSSRGGLAEVTVEELDRCWQVNARGSLLLAQALGRTHDGRRKGGRLVLFTSGQHLGPMDGEIAYAVSKGAINQMTASVANHLADQGSPSARLIPGRSTLATQPATCTLGWPTPFHKALGPTK